MEREPREPEVLAPRFAMLATPSEDPRVLVLEPVLMYIIVSFQGALRSAMSANSAPCGWGGNRISSSLPTLTRPIDLKELTKLNGLSISAGARCH